MRSLPTLLSKIPLFPRVVSLHVVGWVLVLTILHVVPTTTPRVVALQPIAATRPLSAVGERITRGIPATFTIERLNVRLPVIDGVYDPATNNWTLSDDAVQFATMTTLPNDQRGNTFIYGHNAKKVLQPMGNIVVGDTVTITTTNGHTFKYVYTNDAIVPPDMTSILYDNPDRPRLTVMTCEGIWSQARRLMYFDLAEVS